MTLQTQLVLNEVKVPDASVAALFRQGRGMSTLLFWSCFSCACLWYMH